MFGAYFDFGGLQMKPESSRFSLIEFTDSRLCFSGTFSLISSLVYQQFFFMFLKVFCSFSHVHKEIVNPLHILHGHFVSV